MVEFAIAAGRDSSISGSEMFKQMMQHFGSNAKSIQGNWTYGDNLGLVNKLTKGGLSLDEAVLQTWTGKQAALYGFAKSSIQSSTGSSGNYTKIYVLFKK